MSDIVSYLTNKVRTRRDSNVRTPAYTRAKEAVTHSQSQRQPQALVKKITIKKIIKKLLTNARECVILKSQKR